MVRLGVLLRLRLANRISVLLFESYPDQHLRTLEIEIIVPDTIIIRLCLPKLFDVECTEKGRSQKVSGSASIWRIRRSKRAIYNLMNIELFLPMSSMRGFSAFYALLQA